MKKCNFFVFWSVNGENVYYQKIVYDHCSDVHLPQNKNQASEIEKNSHLIFDLYFWKNLFGIIYAK